MAARGSDESGPAGTPVPGADWIRPLLGPADEARAEVWVRCVPPGEIDVAGLEAAGTLTGPRCATAATLPATYRLIDQGAVPGRSPLLRGVCTEPGYWTPDLPCLYDARVELRRDGRVVAWGTRAVGFRRAGTRGGSIRLDGHRFVPRAVRSAGDAPALRHLRGSSRAALVEAGALGDASLSVADHEGVLLVVVCPPAASTAEEGALVGRLEALSAHPSVLVALVADGGVAGSAARVAAALGRRRGSMLLALEAHGDRPPPAAAGLDLLVARLDPGATPHDTWRRGAPVPRVARETAPPGATADALRGACDALQARLAAWSAADKSGPIVDWAGYLAG